MYIYTRTHIYILSVYVCMYIYTHTYMCVGYNFIYIYNFPPVLGRVDK